MSEFYRHLQELLFAQTLGYDLNEAQRLVNKWAALEAAFCDNKPILSENGAPVRVRSMAMGEGFENFLDEEEWHCRDVTVCLEKGGGLKRVLVAENVTIEGDEPNHLVITDHQARNFVAIADPEQVPDDRLEELKSWERILGMDPDENYSKVTELIDGGRHDAALISSVAMQAESSLNAGAMANNELKVADRYAIALAGFYGADPSVTIQNLVSAESGLGPTASRNLAADLLVMDKPGGVDVKADRGNLFSELSVAGLNPDERLELITHWASNRFLGINSEAACEALAATIAEGAPMAKLLSCMNMKPLAAALKEGDQATLIADVSARALALKNNSRLDIAPAASVKSSAL